MTSETSTPDPVPSMPGYTVLARVAKGGMGIVYKGRQEALQRTVALKTIAAIDNTPHGQDLKRRFQREGLALSRMGNHPNIVQVYDLFLDTAVPCVVMEYVEGSTLESLINTAAPPRLEDILRVGGQVARALMHAHQHGVVHRDIKPGNIMVQSNGTVKVMDFGVALLADETRLSMGQGLKGTIHYISPEQINGEDADARSDLYSLAITLFHYATGRVPFDASGWMAIAVMHVESPPPVPREWRSDLPTILNEIILKGLQKDPAKRYQSAEEFLRALEQVSEMSAAKTEGSDEYVIPPNALRIPVASTEQETRLSGEALTEALFSTTPAPPVTQDRRAFKPPTPTMPDTPALQSLPTTPDIPSIPTPTMPSSTLAPPPNKAAAEQRQMDDLLNMYNQVEPIMISRQVSDEGMLETPRPELAIPAREERPSQSGQWAVVALLAAFVILLGWFGPTGPGGKYGQDTGTQEGGGTPAAATPTPTPEPSGSLLNSDQLKVEAELVQARRLMDKNPRRAVHFIERAMVIIPRHPESVGLLHKAKQKLLGHPPVIAVFPFEGAETKEQGAAVANAVLKRIGDTDWIPVDAVDMQSFIGTNGAPTRDTLVKGTARPAIREVLGGSDVIYGNYTKNVAGEPIIMVEFFDMVGERKTQKLEVPLKGSPTPENIADYVALQLTGKDFFKPGDMPNIFGTGPGSLPAASGTPRPNASMLTPVPVATAAPITLGEMKFTRKPTGVAKSGPGGERAVLDFGDGSKLAVRWCPPGSFTMGRDDAASRKVEYHPTVPVEFKRGFWMAETEVTVGQYKKFQAEAGATAAGKGAIHTLKSGTWSPMQGLTWKSPGFAITDDMPVVGVSYEDAAAYCAWATQKLKRNVRLPTEAEWEWAARAGTSEEPQEALNKAAWYGANAGGKPNPTASKLANPWGIHDLRGNVAEWVFDWYVANPGRLKVVDPQGPDVGMDRVVRGGGWNEATEGMDAAVRWRYRPNYRATNIGFRVVVDEP